MWGEIDFGDLSYSKEQERLVPPSTNQIYLSPREVKELSVLYGVQLSFSFNLLYMIFFTWRHVVLFDDDDDDDEDDEADFCLLFF